MAFGRHACLLLCAHHALSDCIGFGLFKALDPNAPGPNALAPKALRPNALAPKPRRAPIVRLCLQCFYTLPRWQQLVAEPHSRSHVSALYAVTCYALFGGKAVCGDVLFGGKANKALSTGCTSGSAL